VQGELLKGMQFRKPDISFDGDYVLDLGGVRVRRCRSVPPRTVGGTRCSWSKVIACCFPATS
jgi:hypothetical protein